MKKILALLLALLLTAALSVCAFAFTGDGTETNPYVINESDGFYYVAHKAGTVNFKNNTGSALYVYSGDTGYFLSYQNMGTPFAKYPTLFETVSNGTLVDLTFTVGQYLTKDWTSNWFYRVDGESEDFIFENEVYTFYTDKANEEEFYAYWQNLYADCEEDDVLIYIKSLEFYLHKLGYHTNDTLRGMFYNDFLITDDESYTLFAESISNLPEDTDIHVTLVWGNEEEPVIVKDTISGADVNFGTAKTEDGKTNVGTGSSVAPVMALSALVVLAGAAVAASKKR